MSDVIATNQTILVVGGGISGVTAAIEAAECGKQVILVEKNPSLGGRVSQLYKYFPKLCFPSCGMEINLRRIKANRNLTRADHVRGLRGQRRGRQLQRHAEDPPALRERQLHRLRRVRKGRGKRIRQRVRLRHEKAQGRLPAVQHVLPAALCASIRR